MLLKIISNHYEQILAAGKLRNMYFLEKGFSIQNINRIHNSMSFPGGSDGKECGIRGFNPWVGKIPWRRKWQPTPIFLPGKFHGWRSLAGYSPWRCKKLDTTERTCPIHNSTTERQINQFKNEQKIWIDISPKIQNGQQIYEKILPSDTREMQIKTTMKCNFILTRMAIITMKKKQKTHKY